MQDALSCHSDNVARGPLTLGRLSHDGGDVYRYRMKRTVRGRDELVLTGKELVKKLAVLVPPPRVHLVRFHGVFALAVVATHEDARVVRRAAESDIASLRRLAGEVARPGRRHHHRHLIGAEGLLTCTHVDTGAQASPG